MSKPVWSYHQKVLLRSAGLGSSSPDSSSSLSDADEDQSPGSRSNEMSKVSSLVRAMGPARSASSISGPSRSTKPMSKRATQAPLPTSLSEPPRCTDHQPMTSNGPSSQDPKAMIPMSSAARTATHAVANVSKLNSPRVHPTRRLKPSSTLSI